VSPSTAFRPVAGRLFGILPGARIHRIPIEVSVPHGQEQEEAHGSDPAVDIEPQ
jgi:hypothetical protein